MSFSISTLGFFVSIKRISIDIKLTQFNFFCLSNNDHSNSVESRGKSVIIAAVLAWNPGQALSWNPRHELTSKGNFVLDSTTFLNFRVPDCTTTSKIACLCTVLSVQNDGNFYINRTCQRIKIPW